MSDSIRSESWWQSRIDEIKSQGFDTKNIVNGLLGQKLGDPRFEEKF